MGGCQPGPLAERIGNVELNPLRSALLCRPYVGPNALLVAWPTAGDLFICAKNLLVEAMAPTGPGTKTFAIDQSFEPDARTRRPTAVGAALKMFGSNMSDEFDSLDASEKAARNNTKRPSDDVVQTAPVKCRYTKSGVCVNIAGFCLCWQLNFALPSSHDARTRKNGA